MRLTNPTLCLLLMTFFADARPFITTWEATSNDLEIDIIAATNLSYDYDVEILDANFFLVYEEFEITGDFIYIFDNPGLYTLKISRDFPNPNFGSSGSARRYTGEQLISIDQWGDIEWKSMSNAFSYVKTEILAPDVPNLSQVTSMYEMFYSSDIPTIDVRDWDVSAVTNMVSLFGDTQFPNIDVSRWDVSSVMNMASMFLSTDVANLDVRGWDVSAVTDMGGLFIGASAANPDVSRWDVSAVTNMTAMFFDTSVANPDVSRWDVSSVIEMSRMFEGATSANPDLQHWQIPNVLYMDDMFTNSGLSTQHYDDMLDNFAGQTVMENVTFSAGTTPYCSGGPSKDALINGKNWIITDGGVECIYHDVSIEVSNQVIDGDNPQVTILVKNNSILVLNDVEVMVDLDMNAATNISWTCDHGGSSCGGTSGSVLETISIPPNTAVTYTVNFDALISDGEYLNISGSAVLLSASEDFPADNVFDKNIQIIYPPIFANGFE